MSWIDTIYVDCSLFCNFLPSHRFKFIIKSFDNFVILLESDSKQNLIYKHSISAILPAKVVNKMLGTEEQPLDFV